MPRRTYAKSSLARDAVDGVGLYFKQAPAGAEGHNIIQEKAKSIGHQLKSCVGIRRVSCKEGGHAGRRAVP